MGIFPLRVKLGFRQFKTCR